MLNQFSTWLAVSPLAIALTTIAFPVHAQPLNLHRLQATLQQAVCLSDWDTAIATLGQMIASSQLSPDYRESLLYTRQQFVEYRARNLDMSWESHPVCVEAIAATPSNLPPEPLPLNPARPLNWQGAVASVAILNGSEASPTIMSPVAAEFSWANASPQAALPPVARPIDACQPESNGDRRLASGSVSNRWRYEILESSRRLFYVRYWDQTNCEFIYQTYRHETQNAAHEEFMARIGADNHEPTLQSVPRSRERETTPQRQRNSITGRG